MSTKPDIINKEFETEEELDRMMSEYKNELVFACKKMALKQVGTVVSYQKAVVNETDLKKFVILITMAFMGEKGMTSIIRKYLKDSQSGVTYASINKLNDEVLDSD